MTNKRVLHIDTADSETIHVELEVGEKRYRKLSHSIIQKAQAVLPLIDALLKECGLTVKDLSAIHVSTGPGSFTGLRVGAAIANTLGWCLGIPVNGKLHKTVLPRYEDVV